MDLKFDEKGLIPAIVQDHYTKEVLTTPTRWTMPPNLPPTAMQTALPC